MANLLYNTCVIFSKLEHFQHFTEIFKTLQIFKTLLRSAQGVIYYMLYNMNTCYITYDD